MATSLAYAVLAILGLGFLVFIHELGHYFVARRRKMRVEAFAIGFGKPIFTWEHKGVKWHICMLPFGGYVKIAGMQKEGSREPSEIKDGFYGKSPWARIQVALAGPVVNIFFAFFAFTVLWVTGGREKQFTDFTHRIGWVDPKSPLYELGVRPGDMITNYDGRPFNGFKDLLTASLMSGDQIAISGYKIDYDTGKHTDFNYTLKTYDNPNVPNQKFNTIGVLSPAGYLIYGGSLKGATAGSPMEKSGIKPNDRILWADGEIVFSPQQLSSLINESTAFLTIQRGDAVFHTKVPRVQIEDLKLNSSERGEIDDWQHESNLKGRLQDLYFIPYNLSPNMVVEGNLNFIDEADQAKAFGQCERCAHFQSLQEGDRILAVDGTPLDSAHELLTQLQTRKVLLIVDRDPAAIQSVLWSKADQQFDQFNIANLNGIVASIGTDHEIADVGPLHLLKPITPKPLLDFPATAERIEDLAKVKKEIEGIKDPQKRTEAYRQLENRQKVAVLGIHLKDREVRYNPTPADQFVEVFQDTWRTLHGLISGVANPKIIAGPVGIIQIVHHSWMIGAKEALFWMALISLNLGIINLLPLPILDGGHIAFSLIEMITKRPLKSKTMERLVIPFVGLIIFFFIYVTYQDIARLFSKFF